MYHMNYMIIMIIADKILNLIYAQLASNWELHLHASYEILKWALPTSGITMHNTGQCILQIC